MFDLINRVRKCLLNAHTTLYAYRDSDHVLNISGPASGDRTRDPTVLYAYHDSDHILSISGLVSGDRTRDHTVTIRENLESALTARSMDCVYSVNGVVQYSKTFTSNLGHIELLQNRIRNVAAAQGLFSPRKEKAE